jgi:hypothetical protein
MTTEGGGGLGLDDLLGQELRQRVGNLQGPSPRAGQSLYHSLYLTGGTGLSVLSMIVATATTKATVALAAAALLVGGGAAAATAATGSTDPTVWGKTVTAAVATCKGHLLADQHGIGQCVSAVAKQKGAEERALHSKAPAPHSTSNPSDVPSTKPSDVPHGEPTDLPHGNPTDLPYGRPNTTPPGSSGGPIATPVGHPSHP